jgi:hypothetical protein
MSALSAAAKAGERRPDLEEDDDDGEYGLPE